jgi:hypothetical protein
MIKLFNITAKTIKAVSLGRSENCRTHAAMEGAKGAPFLERHMIGLIGCNVFNLLPTPVHSVEQITTLTQAIIALCSLSHGEWRQAS